LILSHGFVAIEDRAKTLHVGANGNGGEPIELSHAENLGADLHNFSLILHGNELNVKFQSSFLERGQI
jgi:hypothetical protein